MESIVDRRKRLLGSQSVNTTMHHSSRLGGRESGFTT